MWTPRMTHMKANITYICDLKCPNCNRATTVCPAKANENLPAEQFEKILEDSGKCGKKWKRITLTGGEPTFHPEFNKLVDLMAEYKKKYSPECIITAYTYHHPQLFYKMEKAKADHPDLDVKDTGKDVPQDHRLAMYLAPKDDVERFKKDHIYKGCRIGHLCGLGLDTSGFYYCSIAPGIARVFGLTHLAIKNVEDLDRNKLLDQYQDLCSLCGFYAHYRARKKEPFSPTWLKAIEEFNK